MKNYFSEDELRCKCGCGEYFFEDMALKALNIIREECGFPLPVTSGYRCANHPIEANKAVKGAHNEGVAVDINVYGKEAVKLIEVALAFGCERIGVNQKSSDYKQRFIHLDWSVSFPAPTIWSY